MAAAQNLWMWDMVTTLLPFDLRLATFFFAAAIRAFISRFLRLSSSASAFS